MRLHLRLIVAGASALLGAACTPPPQGQGSPSRDDYVLVTLKRGPGTAGRSDEERKSIQAAHLANIGRLANERKLVVAGPFGTAKHDPDQRGIFILDVTSLDEARALTATDPAVIAGVLAIALEPLSTAADLRGALEAELAEEQAARRAGRERPVSEGIRPYVMIRAEDGATADRVLPTLLPPGTLLISARVNGSQGLYVIDSAEVTEVRGWLGKLYDSPGPITLDQWYASALLVRAAEAPARAPQSAAPNTTR